MRARFINWLYLLPLAIIALGALGSFIAWQVASATSQRAIREAFEADVGRAVATIELQSARHDQLLRALASIVGTQDAISNDFVRALVRDLGGDDLVRGVRSIGYIALEGERARVIAVVSMSANGPAVPESARLAAATGLVRFIRERGTHRPYLLRLEAATGERTEDAAGNAVIALGVARSRAGTASADPRGIVFLDTSPGKMIEGALAGTQLGTGRPLKIAVRASDGVRAQSTLYTERGAEEASATAATASLRGTRPLRLAERSATLSATAQPAAYARYAPNALLVALPLCLALTLSIGATIFLVALQRKARALEAITTHTDEHDRARARLESMVNAAAEALLAVDVAGTIVALNPACEQVFRITRDSVLGKQLSELLPDFPVDRLINAIENGQSSNDGSMRRARLQGAAIRRGARVPVELNVGALTELGPDALIVCAVRDMSEQNRVEEEMRLYKRAIASSSNAIVISDVSMPDQPILYINPAFERMTGYDLADAFGRNCRFLQGPDTDATAVAKMRAAVQRGLDAQVTLKNYTKEGEAFWNHITLAPVRDRNGKVTHYIGIQTDVTETKLVEAALEERRQQLDAIFNLSPDGFVAFGRDRRVTYVNAAFLRITGLEQEDLHNATLETLDAALSTIQDPAHPYRPLVAVLADHDEMEAQDLGADRVGAGAITPDIVNLRNPAPRTIQRSVRRASGGSTDFVLYFRDITRESELDRMKSEFLSSAAHELRTPMVSIFGFAELLLRRKIPEDRQKEMLETIHRQAKHLTNMVNELLDLARIEARAGKDFKLEEMPLAPLIEQTVASILMPSDSRKVEIELPESLPTVRIDSGRMQRAITNIVSNAFKYSPNGGRIRLWTEQRRAKDRDFIGIRVADEGMGMTPEQLAHACERFYRADTSGNIPGTGLGLSLVKEIMELLGGSIEIESEFGRGTTATLWLPIAVRETRPKAA